MLNSILLAFRVLEIEALIQILEILEQKKGIDLLDSLLNHQRKWKELLLSPAWEIKWALDVAQTIMLIKQS